MCYNYRILVVHSVIGMFSEKEKIRESLMRDLAKVEYELSNARIEARLGAVGLLFDLLVEMLRTDQFSSVRNVLGRLRKVAHVRRANEPTG